jgi:hypothetical protein
VRVDAITSLAEAFFFACQGSFQAASMDFDIELCLDRGEALWRRQVGLSGFESDDEVDHVGGEFVSLFWTAGLGHEPGQTGRHECALRLVEGWPGDPE